MSIYHTCLCGKVSLKFRYCTVCMICYGAPNCNCGRLIEGVRNSSCERCCPGFMAEVEKEDLAERLRREREEADRERARLRAMTQSVETVEYLDGKKLQPPQ